MAVGEVITARRPSDQAASEHSALRKVLPSAVVIAAYLLIGIVAFWPLYPGISQRVFSVETDFTLFVMFLGWVPHALAQGLNPFFSNAIFVPTGVNLAQNTGSPLLGLITAPLAPVLNPLERANLLMVLSMPVSATAGFVVLRKWQVWVPAAALGGLIYGFSPYMVGQGLAHVQLMFLPLPPFIALTVVSILRRRGSPRKLGFQLGLLVAAQYLISQELLATVAMFAIAALGCVAIRRRSNIPELARALAAPVGIALAVVAVLLAYPVWMLLAGPQHFTGSSIPATNGYHNDLLSFLVPGPLQKVSVGMRSLGVRLDGSDPVEFSGYIGVPLLIVAGVLAWRSRRSSRTQLAAVLLLGAALLSLGPHLAVNGHLTGIPLPFLLLDHLPLLDNILPIRLCFEVGAFLAALIALGLDDLHRAPARGHLYGSARRWSVRGPGPAVLAGVTLIVLVVTQLPQWPYPASSAVALPATLRQAIPTGDPVAITYPYDTNYTSNQPMLWQAEDSFDFRLLGGYADHPNSSGHATILPSVMSPPGLQQFLAGGLYGPTLFVTPKLVAATRTALSRYDVRLVIVDRSFGQSGPVMELFNNALGPPRLSAGQFSMWADWHGKPSHEEFLPHLFTRVLGPANGATLSGTAALDAATTAWVRVTKVEFLLTDKTHHSTLIAGGHLTAFGWVAKWNTTSVANGTYSLQSIVYDAGGASRLSTSIQITVKN